MPRTGRPRTATGVEIDGIWWVRNPGGGGNYWEGRATIDGVRVRLLLHRYLWERDNCPIPEGYVVHHRDHDTDNNAPDNLMLMTEAEHSAHHSATQVKETRVCVWCAKVFVGRQGLRKKGFCSMSCQGMARKASGVDDVLRPCGECGEPFTVDKYAARSTCGPACLTKKQSRAATQRNKARACKKSVVNTGILDS